MDMPKIALSANKDKIIPSIDYIETNGYETKIYYIKMKKLNVKIH